MSPRISNSLRIVCAAMLFAVGLCVSACEDNEASSDTGIAAPHGLYAVSSLVGKKYILDIPSAGWTAPPGFGDEVVKVQPKFAFEVIDVDESTLTFTALLGAVKDGVQDPCNKTYVAAGVLDGDGMSFTLGPLDIETIFVGPESKAKGASHGLTIAGRIADAGAELVAGSLTAEMDTRDIYPLFYKIAVASGEDVCAAMGEAGVPCTECSFEPGGALCLNFAAEDFTVSDSPDLALIEISEFDDSCLP